MAEQHATSTQFVVVGLGEAYQAYLYSTFPSICLGLVFMTNVVYKEWHLWQYIFLYNTFFLRISCGVEEQNLIFTEILGYF